MLANLRLEYKDRWAEVFGSPGNQEAKDQLLMEWNYRVQELRNAKRRQRKAR